jgi:WD40 repeat protein
MMNLLDPKKAKLTASVETPGSLYAMCYDAAGGKLHGAGTDWAVYCVDLNAEKPAAEKKWTNHENYVSCMALLDGVIVTGGFDRRLIWTAADTGEKIRDVTAHDGWVRNLAALPDGKRLISVGDDMLVKLWNAETGELLQTLEGHAKQTPQGYAIALYAVAVSGDGAVVASGDRIGDVCLWETESGKLLGRLQAPTFYTYDPVTRVRSIGGIRSLRFSPDGTRLAISGIGRVTNVDGFVGPCRVEVWDWQSGKRIFTGQDKHKAVLNDVIFHPTEPWMIAAGGGDDGGLLAIWDQKNEPPAHMVKPKGHIHRLALDSTQPRLYAAGHGGFQFWDFDETAATATAQPQKSE